MKLTEFKNLLASHQDKNFQLVLPNQKSIPVSFHITEVAHIQKRSIDCGGQLHTVHTCQLQAWVSTDDDHRLLAGRMAKILDLAADILPADQDLDIEIEYEDTTISQYPVDHSVVSDNAVVLHLTTKHTDCLAKELCVPKLPTLQMATSCCGPGCCS